ncbi:MULTISPECIES: rhodanese-like domain-containing protein [Candidatus Ichthyocystis]|uniref:Putative thiosulfate sulfurtransferase n=1 Tax=Candidatus Ichthyocystis hellenicum TaxID=1561003 RepID=A0A0S4M4S3_9BURK|nr:MULTISPECIES: rhodanese-like domain-containing protein [Ichthyocystis]CUT17144.1 putative thiosulfate sulfurtransferase [Candidatus Ichthyocystis hellenicum]
MSVLVDFLLHHWVLSGTAILSAAGLLLIIFGDLNGWFGCAGIDPEQLVVMINKGKAVLIDLRQEEERLLNGEIKGSRHITYEKFSADSMPNISSDKSVVLICRDGKRSGVQVRSLKKGGVSAYYLLGGIDAWVASCLPVKYIDKHGRR